MANKIPLISITVHRDKKPVTPPVGRAFDFTVEEIDEIEQMMPGALRNPVNEAPVAAAPAAAEKPAAKGKGKSDDL